MCDHYEGGHIGPPTKTEITGEKHLAHAQRIAQLGYWQWHKQTSKLICSNECRHIFGLNPDEEQETYQPFIAASHPDDRELIAQTMEAALIDG